MADKLWSSTGSGYMASQNLSAKLRYAVQPMVKFRQFCDVKDAAMGGLHKGDTFHWNVYSDVTTAGTELTEANTIPETTFNITQGALTMTEYGNSVPFSQKLDNMSEHPVTEIVNKVLKHDATKAFDTAAAAEFDDTPLRYCGTGATAGTMDVTGNCTSTNNSALNKFHVTAIADTMKERNIPAYTGDDYYCVAKPTTFTDLKGELEAIHQYTPQGFTNIMNGEMGKYRNVRFVEQTYIAGTGTFTANAASDDAYFFGEDTVAEAIAVPEEMRGKIPTDYGRSQGIAWFYLGGFGLCHTTAMGEAQARIVKWDSAA